jgi:hypothetical protein
MTRTILWSLAVVALAASIANAQDDGPRPTDCPPAPVEECINSWKPKPVNPFESGGRTSPKKLAAPSSSPNKALKVNRLQQANKSLRAKRLRQLNSARKAR